MTPSSDHYLVHLPSIVWKAERVVGRENVDALYTMCFSFPGAV